MLPQLYRFTKSFVRPFFAVKAFSVFLAVWLCASVLVPPASAMLRMDSKTIDAALTYGVQNQHLSLADLLGPNWIETENGALLNIYSPFMVLATKAAKSNAPATPNKSDIQAVRRKLGKHVAFYMDTKNRWQVKFAVSIYGNSPSFAQKYEAHIEGVGRGREFNVKPDKRYLDQVADPVANGQGSGSFEAINSYYFNFADLENLDEFRLILESPSGEPIVFRLNNARLY